MVGRAVIAVCVLTGCGRLGFGQATGDGSLFAGDDAFAAADSRPRDGATVDSKLADSKLADAKPIDAASATVDAAMADAASATADASGPRRYIFTDHTCTDCVPGTIFDTQLEQTTPTLNYGGRGFLDYTATSVVLMRWDLSSVPPGTVVVGASIGFYTLQAADMTGTVNIYLCLEAWDEGTGGNNGTAGAASWNERKPGVAWTAAGAGPGSRGTTVLDSVDLSMNATSYGVGFSKTTVQNWINNPATNYGVVMVPTGYTTNWPQTGSRDASQTFRQPNLLITVQ